MLRIGRDPIYHPFAGVDFRHWIKLLRENGGWSPRYSDKVAYLTFKSLRNSRHKKEEDEKYREAIEHHTLPQDPIFVIGHWRSGTTLLENILCNDPEFGYLSVIQSIYPHGFLMRENEYSARFRPGKRYMDNVKLVAESPSEEEVALAVVAPGSFWHGYYFPKRMDTYFKKYVLFEDISNTEMAAWKSAFNHLIKKLSYRYGGKQLVLKNPPNTARIRILLEMYPSAKFIFIHRNPYEVFESRMRQFETAVLAKTLQKITIKEWEQKVLRFYVDLMDTFLEQRDLVPANQITEISFEQLRKNPLNTLDAIYDHLKVSDFSKVAPVFKRYLDGLADYKQNEYSYEKSVIDKVYQHWHRTIDLWYDGPISLKIEESC